MRTSETLLLDFIRQSPQFRIPVNQRRYAWTQQECRQLWEDTPAEPAGARVALFPTDGSLPRYSGGSASALPVSRPAQRSLALRPAWSLSRPGQPVTPKCFSRSRYLLQPLRLLPAGATVAGRGSHPLRDGAFPRRAE